MSDMEQIKNNFLNDIKNHQMTIESESGVNRSILFNTFDHYFRLTTWTGHLCISGDMGCYVFSRTEDMFRFFRQNELSINTGYWAEKLQANSIFGGGYKKYNPEYARQSIINYFLRPLREEGDLEKFREAREELENDGLLSELDEYDFISSARSNSLIDNEPDFWESYHAKEPTYHYIWCLFAIVWGIQQYDKHKNRHLVVPFE